MASMMSVQELFYGESEPVWIISSAAAQIIHHHVQQKPGPPQFSSEQHSYTQYNAHDDDQNNIPKSTSHRDSLSPQMGHHRHGRRHDHQSPRGENAPQYQPPQQQYSGMSQKSPSQHSDDQRNQHNHHIQTGHQRHSESPLRQSSEQSQPHLSNQEAYSNPNSSHFKGHRPSAPPISIDAHHDRDQYISHQPNYSSLRQSYSSQHENHSRQHQNHSSQHQDHSSQQQNHHSQYQNHSSQHQNHNNQQQIYDSQQNFNRYMYKRQEPKVVRMKVPICCEACEDRVVGTLSTIRGVHSVECDLRKEKVTVTGIAAPADILKACKKLFKRSEMCEDRYY